VDPQKLKDALKTNPDARIVAFVQAETSTGVNSDARLLAEIAREAGCLSIVDAVTSLGGSPLKVDEWGIDAVYAGSQKCLSCTPGLSPVSFSPRAVERVKARRTKVQSWFLDTNLLLGYWESANRTYHHTAPINALYSLHEALVMLQEEGLEKSWARHARNHEALKAGLLSLGMAFLVDEPFRLPQLNAVRVPAGVDEKEVRRRLLTDYNLEIGAGLGDLAGRIWRFGLMGHSSRTENVMFCLLALETVLADMGMKIEAGRAEAAAHHAYAAHPRPASRRKEEFV
jgi:alanine-glyoxylate transaminase/serine-glyoxylate transaminase/serine-pyruvate transaminase